MIYAHLDKKVTLTETEFDGDDNGDDVCAALQPCMDPAIMLLCKAIHAEYKEVAYKQTVLYIVFGDTITLSQLRKLLRPGVPLTILRLVKRCSLQTILEGLVRDLPQDQLTEFLNLVVSNQGNTTSLLRAKWTPTKGKNSIT